MRKHPFMRDEISDTSGCAARRSGTRCGYDLDEWHSYDWRSDRPSNQTQNGISDERLAELIAEIEKDIARWPESNKAKAHEVFAEGLSVLRELTALRASHKRLAEALEDALKLLLFAGLNEDCKTSEDFRVGTKIRAALAEARKLEGK